MTTRIWLRLAEILAPTLITAAIILSWEADRRDRAQLASQLAAAQQTIAEATSRQKDRDAQLTQTLAQLAAEKQSALTTDQLIKVLPQALSLPAPIALQAGHSSTTAGDTNVGAGFSPSPGDVHAPASAPVASASAEHSSKPTVPNNPVAQSDGSASNAILPSADLKPLYDFALDCRACQAKLATAQNDLADEKTKIGALTQERDAALRAAKGGTVLRRVARAAKWFLIGAAAGAIASKAVH